MQLSHFADKIFRGETPNDQDWEEHLIAAHELAPSMTPLAFAGFRNLKGLNSYEVLASTFDSLPNNPLNVLDLGCGDGHLIGYFLPKLVSDSTVVGVDISEVELNAARASFPETHISFLLAKAQSLPLKEASQDVVMSHMSLMLMTPIETVAQEVSRVLKPGGVFAAVMGNPRARQKFWGEVQGFVFAFIDHHFPLVKEAKLGDSRVYTSDGLNSIFTKTLGFSNDIESEDFELQIPGTPEGVWQVTKDMYLIGMLPNEQKVQLETDLKQFVRKHPLVNKGKAFGFPMRKIAIKKLI